MENQCHHQKWRHIKIPDIKTLLIKSLSQSLVRTCQFPLTVLFYNPSMTIGISLTSAINFFRAQISKFNQVVKM